MYMQTKQNVYKSNYSIEGVSSISVCFVLNCFMCLSVLSACMSIYYMYTGAYKGQKRALDP